MATIIYKKLDKLVGSEYHEPKQLLKYGLKAYQSLMAWETGDIKDSVFNLYLDTLINKGLK